MSHRDQRRRNASRPAAQGPRRDSSRVSDSPHPLSTAMAWLLAPGASQTLDAAGTVRLRSDCRFNLQGLIVAALCWAWSGERTLTERFQQAKSAAQHVAGARVPLLISYQAFLKLLVRWTEALSAQLKRILQARMEQAFPDVFRIAGFLALGADGSKGELPRTRSNEACYSPRKSQRKTKSKQRTQKRKRSRAAREKAARAKKADSPQMSLTLLFHLGLRLAWDWRTGPSDESERDQLRQMLPDLPADALLVADCGFVGYEFWKDLLDGGREFVIRVGGNVRLLKQLGYARESGGIVYLWPSKFAQRGQPPLVLRLVVLQGGRQPLYVVTSVLNSRRLSDRHVGQLYRQRWGVEVYFRHFKQTYGRGKLRSHKAEHAAAEMQWSLLGLWTMLLYAKAQLPPEARRRLSVVRVLRAFSRALRGEASATSFIEQLQTALLDTYQRRDKRSRGYPRKKYEEPTKRPKIMTASKQQRQQAQRLGDHSRKRLTA